jgi:hypothetical protein
VSLGSSVFALLTTLVGPACDRSREASDTEVSAGAVPLDGLYEVSGFTRNRDTGADERKISGTIAIAVDGNAYRASFDLKTTAPGLEGAHAISVIGRGEGLVVERKLAGTAHTQLVTSVVPGVDPGFAFVPRQTSTRIVSRSTAEIGPDGKATITIESDGAPGENYVATRTRLRGKRVGERPVKKPPAPAVAPPAPARDAP